MKPKNHLDVFGDFILFSFFFNQVRLFFLLPWTMMKYALDMKKIIFVYWEIFAPFYVRPFCSRCQRAHLRLGEFQCLQNISLMTQLCLGEVGSNLFASSWEGRKLQAEKKNSSSIQCTKMHTRHICYMYVIILFSLT